MVPNKWQIGKPGVLLSIGSQRVGHDLVTEKHDPNNHWFSYIDCSQPGKFQEYFTKVLKKILT